MLLEEGVCYDQCILLAKLLAFALFRSVLQGHTCLLLQVSLDFLLLHSSPLWWKGHLLWVLVLEGHIGHHRTVQLQLLQHDWLGHRLRLLWYWISPQWNYEPCRVGPPKMNGSWWRVLTKHGLLVQAMANHFSILALGTPWTEWKGKNIWHWKTNSPGQEVPIFMTQITTMVWFLT